MRVLALSLLGLATIAIGIVWVLQLQSREDPSVRAQTVAESPSVATDKTEVADPSTDPVELAAPEPSNVPKASPKDTTPAKNLPKRAEKVTETVASAAKSQLQEFIEETSALLTKPEEAVDSLPLNLSKLLAGSALGEVQARAEEYRSNGWILKGNPSIVETTISEWDKDAIPESMTVYACVDSSDLKITTVAGTAVPTNNGRAMNIYHLEKSSKGDWKIVRTAFPEDPSC